MNSHTTKKRENILLSLDPEYKRCLGCKKWIHIKKNNIYQNKLNNINVDDSTYNNCPQCNNYLHDGSLTVNEKREIEEIYGNLYTASVKNIDLQLIPIYEF